MKGCSKQPELSLDLQLENSPVFIRRDEDTPILHERDFKESKRPHDIFPGNALSCRHAINIRLADLSVDVDEAEQRNMFS